jgi:aspartyl aminopeptidase
VSIELNVCDTQPSCLGGGNNEFIFSGRLDNLASSYCALRALIDSCESSSDLSNDTAVRMIALFDNEEVILLTPCDTTHRFISSMYTCGLIGTEMSCHWLANGLLLAN